MLLAILQRDGLQRLLVKVVTHLLYLQLQRADIARICLGDRGLYNLARNLKVNDIMSSREVIVIHRWIVVIRGAFRSLSPSRKLSPLTRLVGVTNRFLALLEHSAMEHTLFYFVVFPQLEEVLSAKEFHLDILWLSFGSCFVLQIRPFIENAIVFVILIVFEWDLTFGAHWRVTIQLYLFQSLGIVSDILNCQVHHSVELGRLNILLHLLGNIRIPLWLIVLVQVLCRIITQWRLQTSRYHFLLAFLLIKRINSQIAIVSGTIVQIHSPIVIWRLQLRLHPAISRFRLGRHRPGNVCDP